MTKVVGNLGEIGWRNAWTPPAGNGKIRGSDEMIGYDHTQHDRFPAGRTPDPCRIVLLWSDLKQFYDAKQHGCRGVGNRKAIATRTI